MPKRQRSAADDDDEDADDGRRFSHAWNEHLLEDAAERFDAGRFSAREDALALRAYREACAARGLDGAAALAPVTDAEPFRKGAQRAVWLEVAARFERRTVRAVKRRCERLLHPDARKGRWSARDRARLAALVAQKGHRWTEIGALLGRTPHSCAGAFAKLEPRAIGAGAGAGAGGGGEEEEGGEPQPRAGAAAAGSSSATAAALPRERRRSGDWDAREEAELLRLVRLHSVALPDGGAADIVWSAVAAGMGGARSISQCCSKWAHGASRLLGRAGAWDLAADRALVAAVVRAGADCAEHVPWARLMPGRRSGAECGDRFRALCKRLPAGAGGFADAVDALAEELQVGEEEEEEDEDDNEEADADEEDAGEDAEAEAEAAAAAAAAAEKAEAEQREQRRRRKRARRAAAEAAASAAAAEAAASAAAEVEAKAAAERKAERRQRRRDEAAAAAAAAEPAEAPAEEPDDGEAAAAAAAAAAARKAARKAERRQRRLLDEAASSAR
jgi:hypothetical protein